MSEWKPMESAPKDGCSILAFDAGAGRAPGEIGVVIVSYLGSDRDYPWIESSGMQSFKADILTHWMPLPSPPWMEQG